jgi:hypothetical protein
MVALLDEILLFWPQSVCYDRIAQSRSPEKPIAEFH